MALDAEEPLSDAELLGRYAAGDQAAARALTFRHAPRVLALARRMLGDATEAEDVTQEAMLRMWKIAPDWRADEAAVGTWLYRVASNLCVDRLRRRREVTLDAAPETADETPGALSRLEARDRAGGARRRAGAAARPAAAGDRAAASGGARSNPEIAAILETSVEAVESLLARARRGARRPPGAAAGGTGIWRWLARTRRMA